MQRAWKRVKANKGVAGVDGLDIAQTAENRRWAWPELRQRLLGGTYRPQSVRRVGIPKPDGSERELGIPTVTDRLIQQALLQVLYPLADPTFSEYSHDILVDRLKKRVNDAGVIRLVRAYLNAGIMDGGVVTDRHQGTPHGGLMIRQPTRRNGGRRVAQVVERLRHRLRALHLKQ